MKSKKISFIRYHCALGESLRVIQNRQLANINFVVLVRTMWLKIYHGKC